MLSPVVTYNLPETEGVGLVPRIGNGEYIYPQIPALTFYCYYESIIVPPAHHLLNRRPKQDRVLLCGQNPGE